MTQQLYSIYTPEEIEIEKRYVPKFYFKVLPFDEVEHGSNRCSID